MRHISILGNADCLNKVTSCNLKRKITCVKHTILHVRYCFPNEVSNQTSEHFWKLILTKLVIAKLPLIKIPCMIFKIQPWTLKMRIIPVQSTSQHLSQVLLIMVTQTCHHKIENVSCCSWSRVQSTSMNISTCHLMFSFSHILLKCASVEEKPESIPRRIPW